jgi:PAS domain S-box-containing protein
VLASQAAMALENSRLYRDLEERESKIRRLVDANVVGVLISNLDDGQIIEANDAFLDMVGFTRDDLTSGRIKWTELTPPEWLAASQRAMAQLRATGGADLFEKEYLRKDGSRVPVLVAAAALEGTPIQSVAFVVDLTERRRAEAERERLRQLQADLVRISRITTMGEMTASLSHEIRQPIAAAMTDAKACVRWLAREHPDLGEARASAERIVDDTTRAAEIINRVASLFKKGSPQREAVDVNELARETLALLRLEMERYRVSLRTDLASDVPWVAADRVQLQQVLMNLMLNAIEAMQGTGGELSVMSKCGEDGALLFSVSDTGVGLPADKADAIFEAFFTTKPQGTGMGLSISRSIVESHGGRLWATSGTERGATFHFSLPAEDSS